MTTFRCLVALIACAVSGMLVASRLQATSWDQNYFPNVELLTHHGERVRFYDDLVRDRIVVINFVYTECPDICSLSTARLAQVADWLGDRLGTNIHFLSITLDPKNDTSEKLAAYAKAFGERNGWVFLTGAPEDLDLLGYRLGERGDNLNEHRSDLVIGNGTTGEWRRSSPMGSLTTLTREILEMDPAWRSSSNGSSFPKQVAASRRRGEALFLQGCASCHSIGDGIRVGPDLAGVTLRRTHKWLTSFIMTPDALRTGKDQAALALDRAFPGVRMPNLGIGETDAEDLVHYLRTETERLDAQQSSLSGYPSGSHDHSGGHDHSDEASAQH